MKASAKDRYFQWELDHGVTAKIRYTEQGTEHAGNPPILFLHGYGGMIEHWDLNIPEFAASHKNLCHGSHRIRAIRKTQCPLQP